MSPDIETNVDWTAPAPPTTERFGPGLKARARTQAPAPPQRDVMATLLGKHNLSAVDASGGDPYNATGRHLRR